MTQASFDRASRTYQELALVQSQVAEHLLDLIEAHHFFAKDGLSTLDLGCGAGYLARALLKRYPMAKVVGLDYSAGMLEQALSYDIEGFSAIQGDLEKLELSEKYNLICSSSSLHWISDIGALLKQLRDGLAIDGTLAFSTMLEGTFSDLVDRVKQFQPEFRPRVDYLSLEAVLKELRNRGFQVLEFQEKTYRESFKSGKELLESLRLRGVQGASGAASSLSFGQAKRLVDSLDESEEPALSYNVGFFVCKAA